MSKIEQIREVLIIHRKKRNKFEVTVLSTLLGDIEKKLKGSRNSEPEHKDIVKGTMSTYYDNLIMCTSPNIKTELRRDSIKELRFLRDSKIIENRMNEQEIDLQLLAIYNDRLTEDKSFSQKENRNNVVLTTFVKQFVPTVADLEVVKSRLQKIFNK